MSNEIECKIGQEIVRLRRAMHWSQERLAREAKVSRHYLSEVENGSRQVSVGMIVRIVEAMGFEVRVVIGEMGASLSGSRNLGN